MTIFRSTEATNGHRLHDVSVKVHVFPAADSITFNPFIKGTNIFFHK
jgi:hypothetical protein